ncbi:helix-turn-helix domain-containing protein [Lacticaseibacillus sp. GG6-2]
MAIRNRFAVLLAQRNLSVTQVADGTGLSRNALTAIKYHRVKMIQYVTLDSLCQYLHVTPGEFFDYDPHPSSPDWYLTQSKGR